jgi:hypothetical protein
MPLELDGDTVDGALRMAGSMYRFICAEVFGDEPGDGPEGCERARFSAEQ